ncbi:hypothetical protein ACIBJC_15230 [Streptomyces sp. NPDC050509]|uniref:hypothetical protein n=1 Tax=Streptomyces sp. NPDC050509 TaxID=3365620 RepID=UPI0037919259
MNTPTIVDIYAAAAATGTDPRTLRKRLSRGTLTHHGYDRQGRALVDLAEVQTRAAVKAA